MESLAFLMLLFIIATVFYFKKQEKTTRLYHYQEVLALTEEIKALKEQIRIAETQIKNQEEGLARFQAITNLEAEIQALENQIYNLQLEKEEYVGISNQLYNAKNELEATRNQLETLQREVFIEKELVEDYGFERFKFEYDDSERYKEAIKNERDYQRQLIKDGRAALTITAILFNNSKAEGEKVQDRAKKLLIRTFNGEVEDVIKRLTFRNVDSSRNKIKKSFESLNNLNKEGNFIKISDAYLESKIRELDLNYGKRVKEEEEKELKKEERELLREQKAAEREIQRERKRQEKERKKKEKEIELKEKILKQVTEELGLNDEKTAKAIEEIEKLKAELQDVLERENSISQAEITTAGYVYIISNIGSFGEDVFKIGLTRRLEPEQRINELSSASVPFQYNCHGMIWSLNAVELEAHLHEKFDDYRVNKVNRRKEFFRVPFSVIEEEILRINPDAELIKDVEAEEYYQSLAIEKRQEMDQEEEEEFVY